MKATWIVIRSSVAILILLLIQVNSKATAQSAVADRPLPAAASFLEAVHQNLARQYDDAFLLDGFTYHVKSTRDELTADGTLKAQRSSDHDVIYNNGVLQKLVWKDGKPPSPKDAATTKHAPVGADVKGRQKAIREAKAVVDDIFRVMNLRIVRREIVRDRPAIVVEFSPRNNVKPQTSDGERILTRVQGFAWVDETDNVLARIELRLIEGFKQTGPLAVRIEKGGEISRDWLKFRNEIWLPASETRHLTLRAFGKKVLVQRTEYSEYKKFSSETTIKVIE
jgi:hypothetical protein